MGKLVRDKIPSMINNCDYRVLDDFEFEIELYKKLEEEVAELLECPGSLEEIADVAEVLYTILKNSQYTLGDLITAMEHKNNNNGAFEKRYYWNN